MWAIYLYGGLVFPVNVSSQLDSFWKEEEVVIKDDLVCAPKGKLRDEIRKHLAIKVGKTIDASPPKVANLPELLGCWGASEDVKSSSTNTKILHILPGQEWEFTHPKGWELREWRYYKDIPQYNRFSQRVPFHMWVIYLYGGLAFPAIVSSQLDPFWKEEEVVVKYDSVCAPKGKLRGEIRKQLMGKTIDD